MAEIDLAGPRSPRRCRVRSSRCSRRSRRSRSATRTGCSRSSGTAIASRRSSATARSSSGRGAERRRDVLPELLSPPTWIEAKEAIVDGEIVALDDDGRPDFSLSRSASALGRGRGGRRRGRSSTRCSTCSTSTGARSLDVPLEDRKRLLELVLRETSRVRFASHVDRRGRGVLRGRPAAAARGRSSPSSGGRATSRAAGRRPG